jgi:spermidine/putrescine transport system ATP-binding protein
VTHDQEEALSMSDRVCIMREGRIVQEGSPRELYDEPVNAYVADFVGKSNQFEAKAGTAADGNAEVSLANGMKTRGRPTSALAGNGASVVLSVRPEQIRLAGKDRALPRDASFNLEAKIVNRIFLGEHVEYLLAHETLGTFMALSPRQTDEGIVYEIGETVNAGWPPAAALVLKRN